MPQRTQASHPSFLRQLRSVKFFLVCCMSFAFFLHMVHLARQDQTVVTKRLDQEAAKNSNISNVSKYNNRPLKDFKYMLLWTESNYAPFYYFGEGQNAFLKNNCSVTKCYVTSKRNFFGGDLTKFDAIAFNGRNMNPSDLPKVRSQHQKYIFFSMESADNYPVCKEQFEGFFNWTSTYRLDSDIPYPYILIRDDKGKIVGPKQDMQWKQEVGDEFDRKKNKTKAAAVFMSHCTTRSGRHRHVRELNRALKKYGLAVDVYGMCGALRCPTKNESFCNNKLKREYYFYMSMENSFDKDYVTEKLLMAVQHDVVPIVFGGADYSRFLPPGSYVNSRTHRASQLAAMIDYLIHSPDEYNQYFWWKHYYTYHNPVMVENVCAVCEALHDKKMLQNITIYEDFRKWWHPQYKHRCL